MRRRHEDQFDPSSLRRQVADLHPLVIDVDEFDRCAGRARHVARGEVVRILQYHAVAAIDQDAHGEVDGLLRAAHDNNLLG